MSEPKKMSAKEFRRLGYLQELNRLFLHPLGLALEVKQDREGNEWFGDVWDYRNDPEGFTFDDSVIDDEFVERAQRIEGELADKLLARKEALGYLIQPAERK